MNFQNSRKNDRASVEKNACLKGIRNRIHHEQMGPLGKEENGILSQSSLLEMKTGVFRRFLLKIALLGGEKKCSSSPASEMAYFSLGLRWVGEVFTVTPGMAGKAKLNHEAKRETISMVSVAGTMQEGTQLFLYNNRQ